MILAVFSFAFPCISKLVFHGVCGCVREGAKSGSLNEVGVARSVSLGHSGHSS